MSIALVEAWREKQRVKWIVKFLLRRVAQPCVLVVLAYIFPKLAIFYAICGLYDVSRNRVNVTTLRRYFLGNGFATWALSPINVFLRSLPDRRCRKKTQARAGTADTESSVAGHIRHVRRFAPVQPHRCGAQYRSLSHQS